MWDNFVIGESRRKEHTRKWNIGSHYIQEIGEKCNWCYKPRKRPYKRCIHELMWFLLHLFAYLIQICWYKMQVQIPSLSAVEFDTVLCHHHFLSLFLADIFILFCSSWPECRFWTLSVDANDGSTSNTEWGASVPSYNTEQNEREKSVCGRPGASLIDTWQGKSNTITAFSWSTLLKTPVHI